MTTYNLSGNIRTANDSDTQNVGTFDTVVITLSTHYGVTVESQSNVSDVSISVSGGSGTNSTSTITVKFFAAGSYSLVIHQAYFNKRYTLTGTATGATNYGYGLHIFDSNGTPRLDVLNRQPRVVGFFTGTGQGSGFDRTFIGYNGTSSDNRADEWYALSLEPNSNYYVNDTGTIFGKVEMERADVRSNDQQGSYQVLFGNEDFRVVVIRM